MGRIIPQITAAFILIISVIAILFSAPLGLDLTEEAFMFLGTMTGASVTFLFLARTKNNGSLVSSDNG